MQLNAAAGEPGAASASQLRWLFNFDHAENPAVESTGSRFFSGRRR
jgi:hypothetical protein